MKIKGREFGKGMPLICISVTENAAADMVAKAADLAAKDIDVIELRADHLSGDNIISEINDVLDGVRDVAASKIILFTYRTLAEGGNGSAGEDIYMEVLEAAAYHEAVDIIDIESNRLRDPEAIINKIKKQKTVLLSYHDFNKTPSTEFMTGKLSQMYELGADIAKIAVMPESKRDVARLLEATAIIDEAYPDRPKITISMGALGLLSRLSGQCMGSCLTFATDGAASAPGQVPYQSVKTILNEINRNMEA